MTKYVELVIVADNREVRTFPNFSLYLVKKKNTGKRKYLARYYLL